jgi:hypothetical protein
MKNGELYDAATLKQEWPRERALPAFFWRASEETKATRNE